MKQQVSLLRRLFYTHVFDRHFIQKDVTAVLQVFFVMNNKFKLHSEFLLLRQSSGPGITLL